MRIKWKISASPFSLELALDVLLRHPEVLTPLKPASPAMRTLMQLVQDRRRLVQDRVRITNRLTYALKNYYPQALSWFKDKDTVVFCDFLTRWPTLKHAQRARKASLERFFYEHNVRYSEIVEQRVANIKGAMPLTEDEAIIKPQALLAGVLVAQLRGLLEAIEAFDQAIAEATSHTHDYALFERLPGAGAVMAPRLLVAFGEDRNRYQGADQLQKYAGIAPVTESSGQKHWVHWRYAAPTFLRQTFVEWAAETIPRSYWAQAYYQQQRAKGKRHQAAIRALAFKWIRILYRCWQDRRPYDETTYLNALRERGSSLLQTAE